MEDKNEGELLKNASEKKVKVTCRRGRRELTRDHDNTLVQNADEDRKLPR